MPRTKIPKNSKRNREVANREEKVRLYELKMDSRLISIDSLETKFLSAVDHQVKTLLGQVQKELANLKMPEVLRLFEELDRFSDFKASDQTQLLASMSMSGSAIEGHAPSATGSRNDEGLLAYICMLLYQSAGKDVITRITNEYRFYTPNGQIPLYIRYSSYPLVAIFTFNFNLTGVRLCD